MGDSVARDNKPPSFAHREHSVQGIDALTPDANGRTDALYAEGEDEVAVANRASQVWQGRDGANTREASEHPQAAIDRHWRHRGSRHVHSRTERLARLLFSQRGKAIAR